MSIQTHTGDRRIVANPVSVVVSANPSSNTAGYALVDEADVLHSLDIYSEESGMSLYDAKLDAYTRAVAHAASLPAVSELCLYSNGLETEDLYHVATQSFSPTDIEIHRTQHPHTAFVESLSTNQVHLSIRSANSETEREGVLYVDGSYLEQYDSGAGGYVLFDRDETTVLDLGAFSVEPSPAVEQYTVSAALSRVLSHVDLENIVIRTDSQAVRQSLSNQSCVGPLAPAAELLRTVPTWSVEYLPREENYIAHILSQVGHRNTLALLCEQ